MRSRRPAVLTVLALGAALTLGACNDAGEEPTGEPTGQTSEAAPDGGLPTVEGGYGEEPTITFPDSQAPAELKVEVLKEGDGTEVAATDFVVADYHGQVWGQDQVFDSSFQHDEPSGFSLDGVIPGWKEGLAGTHVGDRVLLSIPPELGYGEQAQGESIPPGSTLVFVVDVVERYAPDTNAQADSTPVEPAPDLPVSVEGDLGAPATITVDDGAPTPTEPEATVIAEGSGEPVAQGGVLVQYGITSWDNSTQQSTWESGGVRSVTVGAGTVFDLLADVPVGSRVVIQAPPSQGSGQTPGQPAVAAVVDVVGTIAAR
ncbi:FKBP-type peptidyl-prolyl cis-trans isomerase [Georgenia halophila]|uniref:Peptidyl-prolyl cis-trans isomerase n=1 Tax=Georgenia halophila TaxID=620889 RepID=A0ABP8LQ03_9MICO